MSVLITHERRQAFKECPRKLYWAEVAGVERSRRSTQKSIDLGFKTGIEAWRSFKGQEPVPAIAAGVAVMAGDMILRGCGADDKSLQEATAKLTAYLSGYFAAYAADVPHLKSWYLNVKVETTEIAGTIPAMYEDDDGRTWVVVDQLASVHEGFDPEAMVFNEEVLHYGNLIQARGWDVGGVIWRRSTYAYSFAENAAVMDKFAYDLLVEYTSKTSLSYFRELELALTDEQLDAYAHHARPVDDLIRSSMIDYEGMDVTVGWFPFNGMSCVSVTGECCPYLTLCKTGPAGALVSHLYQPISSEPLDGGSFQKTVWPATRPGQLSSEPAGTDADDGGRDPVWRQREIGESRYDLPPPTDDSDITRE